MAATLAYTHTVIVAFDAERLRRERGELAAESNYVNGKQEGLSRSWYKSGELQRESNYVNGKQEGLARDWRETGELEFERNYVNGKQEGLFRYWYENGELARESCLKAGEFVAMTHCTP